MTKPLLMVIDDLISMAELVSTVAEGLGFEVQMYSNSHDFKAAYLKSPPSAIVMDIVMPDLDANELLKWLVNQDSSTPVVIMSGFEGKYLASTKLLAEKRGAVIVGTLTKPFSIKELERILNEIMASFSLENAVGPETGM